MRRLSEGKDHWLWVVQCGGFGDAKGHAGAVCAENDGETEQNCTKTFGPHRQGGRTAAISQVRCFAPSQPSNHARSNFLS